MSSKRGIMAKNIHLLNGNKKLPSLGYKGKATHLVNTRKNIGLGLGKRQIGFGLGKKRMRA